jgi:hypothetical protein
MRENENPGATIFSHNLTLAYVGQFLIDKFFIPPFMMMRRNHYVGLAAGANPSASRRSRLAASRTWRQVTNAKRRGTSFSLRVSAGLKGLSWQTGNRPVAQTRCGLPDLFSRCRS